MDSIRWAPPLPTIGRAGPRIAVLPSSTYTARLEQYYLEHRSVSDLFERRVPPHHIEACLRYRTGPQYLAELTASAQQSVLLRNLYFRTSDAFVAKLRRRLDSGRLNTVRSWFHTANGVVLPLLISSDVEPRYEVIDKLTKWALENCANNYAQFQSDLKSLKKRIRKRFATTGNVDFVPGVKGTMCPYLRVFQDTYRSHKWSGPAESGRFVLLWTQTRATGLADGEMVRRSLEKFKSTVTEPGLPVTLNPQVLSETVRGATRLDGSDARVSVGPTACLEVTRQGGGKTEMLSYLCRNRTLVFTYNLETLEPTRLAEPRPVRNPSDLLNWSIQECLHRNAYVRSCRVHAVVEPGKARTITVAPFAYQVLMGVFAHLFQPTLRSKAVRSGLKADRHLWRFLRDVMNPQNTSWEFLTEYNVFGLSTDLSEATDFGHRGVARQIWHALIEISAQPGFPTGAAVLAKTLYCSRRFFFVPCDQGYELVTSNRGWMMGDMMTKVILTIAHDYCCRSSLLRTYSLVGDDEIALSSDPARLREHIRRLNLIFKVSDDDTYISRFFAFYCEEGTIIPQSASWSLHVQMRRGEELLYLDYPRIRLLLPEPSETQSYSQTNIGRFALLGKEARWVNNVNPYAEPYFTRASLLQHILVPQDRDTISPYTPIEIGGDGAFPHTGEFMRRAVHEKSRDPRETLYRLSALMNNSFGHKFVRSDRLDKVVNKHHLYLPKIEEMEKLLPPSAVVKPQTDEARVMLQSTRFEDLETPERTFFRLCRGLYYQDLFRGRKPPEPVFSIERRYTGGHTDDPYVDFHEFRDRWMNPGFKFQDQHQYWVLRKEVGGIDPLNLQWDFKIFEKSPTASEIFNLWVRENVSFEETSLPEILAMIKDHRPLPQWVVERLNLFIESDSYVLHTLPSNPGRWIPIVTRDIKLCKKILDVTTARRGGEPTTVIAIDPLIYLVGRTPEIEGRRVLGWREIPHDLEPTVDPGSKLHVDYTEFTDGFPLREDIFDAEIRIEHTRWEGVIVAKI